MCFVQEYEVFWPVTDENIEAENFRVKLVREHAHSTYVTREFTIQSLQDDYERNVRMVHSTDWPNNCTSISEIYQLPNAVQDTQQGYQNGPLVIVDRYVSFSWVCSHARKLCRIFNTLLLHVTTYF